MTHRSAIALIALVFLPVLLSGCGTPGKKPPVAPVGRDLSAIPDAVPKIEPKSAYGNPPSYEVFGKRYVVLPDSRNFVERGLASWYGPGFHDKLTSTRETYDMYAMTAAHKSLPLPTYAEVTNLSNGRKVIVRINDRGPFVGDRVIDLSYVAAWKLGIDGPGTAPVEVRAIDPYEWLQTHGRLPANAPIAVGNGVTIVPIARAEPVITPLAAASPSAAPEPAKPAVVSNGGYYVQAGAFANPDNARKLRDLIRVPDVAARVVPGGNYHRVQVGPLASREEAERVRRQLAQSGIYSAHLIDGNGQRLEQ
ncbi:MAG TPA: septal ring lytic transglycosylase RlpA family protein [Methylococcaceae bacterium]|nr:septal ring lytic transglycosylase RlpA family protein [Methylococcaceae bacterium]